METRKIQQVGGGTYTVSLPKEWATAADIEPGATVALHTHIDGTLVVQTGAETRDATTSLSVAVADTGPTSLERTLRAAYAAGVETVEIEAPDGLTDDHVHTVERVTRNLTGITVTESTEQTMQIRSLLDAREVSISQSVRQLQFAALSAHRDATAALTSPTAVEQPADRDDQADRLYAMVDRYFQRGLDSLSVMDALGLTRPELFVHWVAARELERVADHAERIAGVANSLETPVEGKLAADIDDLADRTQTVVRDSVGLIVDEADICTVHRVLDERDRIVADVATLDQRLFDTDDGEYRLTHALDSLRRTADNAGDIAELGLRSWLRDAESQVGIDCQSHTALGTD